MSSCLWGLTFYQTQLQDGAKNMVLLVDLYIHRVEQKPVFINVIGVKVETSVLASQCSLELMRSRAHAFSLAAALERCTTHLNATSCPHAGRIQITILEI